jgi:hypothetical protein
MFGSPKKVPVKPRIGSLPSAGASIGRAAVLEVLV